MSVMLGNSEEIRPLINALSKLFGLPKNVRWMEIRIASDEAVTVRCAYYPDSLNNLSAEELALLPLTATFEMHKKP